MNYVIWKGINSNTIKGLIITELPPITKPKMRVQETQIDGVDGSIIEELGYEPYDKTLQIGLTRDANIDEIISYFTGEGDIVFSNEPDKYYKVKIIDQIDYERLLRFRTASVKFRVQPFKYEYNEEKAKLLYKTISGTTINFENNNNKLVQLSIGGNSTQEGTPTPDAPVEIKSVGYENLFNKSITPVKSSGIEYEELETGLKVSLTTTGGYKYIGIPISNSDYLLGKKITLSSDILVNGNNNALIRLNYIDDKGSVIAPLAQLTESGSHTNDVLTSYPDGATQIALFIYANNTSADANVGDYIEYTNIQVVVGSAKKEYIPYGKYGLSININNTNKIIALDEPLRSLPNGIKDLAYIRNNNFCVNRKVGKVVLTGNEAWRIQQSTANKDYYYIFCSDYDKLMSANIYTINELCNRFEVLKAFITSTKVENEAVTLSSGTYKTRMMIKKTRIDGLAGNTLEEKLKVWLSNNKTEITYELLEPVTENLGAISVDLVNDTNTITNSESANMTLAYIDNGLIVNNTGNYLSKPVITIKGSETIEFILNGNKLFSYTFPDDETEVIIDSEKQDAYLGTMLKNRNMSGEFPIFEIGENTITWEGSIESIEVSQKSRWL